MKKKLLIGVLVCSLFGSGTTYAEEAKTTITIDAEDDSGGKLFYAIDSKSNFTQENTFEVESGTTHIVYIKDEAGNVTEQTVIVPKESSNMVVKSEETVNDEDTAYSTAPDSGYVPAEAGGGTVYDNTATTGNSSDEAKQFLTVTTKNDHTFYVVIDNAGSSDNVYLLDQVTDEDLIDLIAEEDARRAEQIVEEQEVADSEIDGEANVEKEKSKDREKSSGTASKLLVLAFVGGASFLYMRYKKKKNEKYDEDELDEEEDILDLKENFKAVEDEETESEEDIFYGRGTDEAEESEEFEEATDVEFEDEYEEDDDEGVE